MGASNAACSPNDAVYGGVGVCEVRSLVVVVVMGGKEEKHS